MCVCVSVSVCVEESGVWPSGGQGALKGRAEGGATGEGHGPSGLRRERGQGVSGGRARGESGGESETPFLSGGTEGHRYDWFPSLGACPCF